MANKLLTNLSIDQKKQVLSVLTAMVKKSPIKNKLGYLKTLIDSVLTGSFSPPSKITTPQNHIKPKPKASSIKKNDLPTNPVNPVNPVKTHHHIIKSPAWQEMRLQLGIRNKQSK